MQAVFRSPPNLDTAFLINSASAFFSRSGRGMPGCPYMGRLSIRGAGSLARQAGNPPATRHTRRRTRRRRLCMVWRNLQQRRLTATGCGLEADGTVTLRREDASLRGAGEVSLLDQERLMD